MKVSFNLYFGDIDKGEIEQYYHNVITTDVTVEKIKCAFDLIDTFEENIFVFDDLVFWDIITFGGPDTELISKIEKLPQSTDETKHHRLPWGIIRYDSHEEFVEQPKPHRYYAREEHKFECGASGFGQFIEVVIGPLAISIAANAIFDWIKRLKAEKQAKKKGIEFKDNFRRYTVFTKYKKLYRNFEKATGISSFSCRVIEIDKNQKGSFKVKMRTLDNALYELEVNHKGQIISLNESIYIPEIL